MNLGRWRFDDRDDPADGDVVLFDLTRRAGRFKTLLATALTSATAWVTFYTNGSKVLTELALGARGTAVVSTGATAAPTAQLVPIVQAKSGTIITISNTVTETTLLTYTLAAAPTTNGGMIRMRLFGAFTYNRAAGDTLTFNVYQGATNLLSWTVQFNSNTLTPTRGMWHLEVCFGQRQTGNALNIFALLTATDANTGQLDVIASRMQPDGAVVAAGVIMAANDVLAVKAQWSAASTSNRIDVYNTFVEEVA